MHSNANGMLSTASAAASSANTAVQSPGLKTYFKTPEGRYKLHYEKTHPSGLLHYAHGKTVTQVRSSKHFWNFCFLTFSNQFFIFGSFLEYPFRGNGCSMRLRFFFFFSLSLIMISRVLLMIDTCLFELPFEYDLFCLINFHDNLLLMYIWI